MSNRARFGTEVEERGEGCMASWEVGVGSIGWAVGDANEGIRREDFGWPKMTG
jgi:hypothetical protein